MYKNFQKGSLLIELLVSIGILGLIASITMPYIRISISNIVLANVVKEITTDLRNAQQQTISEQTFYYAQFIMEENKYRIIEESTETIIKEKILPPEINFYSINGLTDNEARFNYFGAAIESGTIIFVNTSTNAMSSIEIKPAGYIRYN
ncbi:MAG: type II secretion system protein [bacterium]